ncbi:MAG TPA: hypothetical protein VGH10_10065 [Actinomycetota bacterium]|jgi:hypothetical protein
MRRIGRRAQFFFVLGIVSLALVWPTPPQFRWVAWLCVGLAGLWGVLFSIEDLASPHAGSRLKVPADEAGLFAPPPAPGQQRPS